jgi:hypothetical protein
MHTIVYWPAHLTAYAVQFAQMHVSVTSLTTICSSIILLRLPPCI